MRIFIDSNILISAMLSKGTPFRAYQKAISNQNQGIICSQNIEEIRRIFNRKFPDRLHEMEQFLALAVISLEIVPVPEIPMSQENEIRDIKDRSILRAAIQAKADILLTGDKDFLESGILTPQVMTAAAFLAFQNSTLSHQNTRTI